MGRPQTIASNQTAAVPSLCVLVPYTLVRGLDPQSNGDEIDPHSQHGSLLKPRQFHLLPFASMYSAANEYQHCWDGSCGELASCPGESV